MKSKRFLAYSSSSFYPAALAVCLLAGCANPSAVDSPPVLPTTTPVTQAATAPATARAAMPTPGPEEAQFLTEVAQLTFGFDRAGEGYFSPDMRWVIFQAAPHGEPQYQMYVAPLHLLDGTPRLGPPVRISPEKSRNTCGFFAPDGKSLIFASTAGKEKPDEPSAGYQRSGGNYRWAFPDGMEIYGVDDWKKLVAPAVERLSPTTETARPKGPVGAAPPPMVDLTANARHLTDNSAYDAEGAFSPDGKWICFTSRRTLDSEVWVMRADGSHSVQITHAKGYDGGPFFAPDGKRLVYRSDRKGNDLLQIFVADLAFDEQGNITGSTAERQITDDANVNWGPYFHPDNRHLIYATSAHGHTNYELYVMRDDGSHKTRITYTDGFDGLPVFSPDGRYLMWSAKRSADNTTQVFIARFHQPTDW